MHLPTALALASTASLAAAHPFTLTRRAVPAIPNTSTFDILLAGNLNDAMSTFDENIQVMILDMQGNTKETIADLKSLGKTVLCYFSGGTYEPGRDDSKDFLDADLGKTMKDWPDEKWLDVESENVKKIMTARIQTAADKGCAGVDVDNVDGYQEDNDDGFSHPASSHATYVKFLAGEAASRNLAMGLKNALDLIPDVVDSVQFAVNEECHQYGECGKYKPFTDAGKAVFNIEYNGQCGDVDGVKMSTVKKTLALDKLGGQCNAGAATPATPATPSGSGNATLPAVSAKPEATEPSATEPAATKPAATKPVGTTTPPMATPPVPGQPGNPATPTSVTVPKPSASSTVPDRGNGQDDDDQQEDNDDNQEDGDDEDDDQEDEDEEDQHWHRPGHGFHGSQRNSTRGQKEE